MSKQFMRFKIFSMKDQILSSDKILGRFGLEIDKKIPRYNHINEFYSDVADFCDSLDNLVSITSSKKDIVVWYKE